MEPPASRPHTQNQNTPPPPKTHLTLSKYKAYTINSHTHTNDFYSVRPKNTDIIYDTLKQHTHTHTHKHTRSQHTIKHSTLPNYNECATRKPDRYI